MKSPNFIFIFSLIVYLSFPINTEQLQTNTTSYLYDQPCKKQLIYFDNALLARKPWALEGSF